MYRRLISLVLLLTATAVAITPLSASAKTPTPHDEQALIVKNQQWRRALVVASRLWWQDLDHYVGKLEQAEYDREQEARVRAAVERYSPERGQVRPPSSSSPQRSESEATPEGATGRCGGDLPSCEIMRRESGGNIRAQNSHSSASGKWQFIDGTWNNFGGYAHAKDAPEHVQDEKARQVWAGGAGCRHWSQTASGC